MKKKIIWYLQLSLLLLTITIGVYSLQILIFKNLDQTGFYFFQDLAFLPIEVLLVTILIDRLLKRRDKSNIINKMNMVVGIFFSEMGHTLLKDLYGLDKQTNEEIKEIFKNLNSKSSKLKLLKRSIEKLEFKIDIFIDDLKKLKEFLILKKSLLLGALENPNLMEHESFTDLLWAVSHLDQELLFHGDLDGLSEMDMKHLENDIIRAYKILLTEWMAYLIHLEEDYPYIHSLYKRNNPLA